MHTGKLVMLVVSRKVNEGIHIGDDIVIKIAKIEGKNVRLAIKAPENLAIYREELISKKVAESEKSK